MSYPSRSETARLERWPQRIELQDLRESFALGDRDREVVFGPRGAENRLGLAVQLCALRFLGFVPTEIAGIPEPALRFLCEQTETEPHELLPYGERAQTRSAHLMVVREHLDFRAWDPRHADELGAWLAERALEHERPSVLMSLACEHLRARRIVRPSITVLARTIGAARERSHETVLERLSGQLRPPRCSELDGLLEVDPARKVSEIAWLRTPISRVGIRGALAQVEKYARLSERAGRRRRRPLLASAGTAPSACRAGPSTGRSAAHEAIRGPGGRSAAASSDPARRAGRVAARARR